MALQELKKHGDLAFPLLRRRLEQTSSPDERKLIEELLRSPGGWSPDRFQRYRAVQVLEYMATTEAKALLQEFANGAPTSEFTKESSAALARTGKGVRHRQQ